MAVAVLISKLTFQCVWNDGDQEDLSVTVLSRVGSYRGSQRRTGVESSLRRVLRIGSRKQSEKEQSSGK
jgi:hypothetical protein